MNYKPTQIHWSPTTYKEINALNYKIFAWNKSNNKKLYEKSQLNNIHNEIYYEYKKSEYNKGSGSSKNFY